MSYGLFAGNVFFSPGNKMICLKLKVHYESETIKNLGFKIKKDAPCVEICFN